MISSHYSAIYRIEIFEIFGNVCGTRISPHNINEIIIYKLFY